MDESIKNVELISKKHFVVVFFLFAISYIIPSMKTVISMIGFLLMFSGKVNYIFMAYSWINVSTLLSPYYFGYLSTTDTVIRLLSTFLAFLFSFFHYRKIRSLKNPFFYYQFIFCVSLIIISLLNFDNDLISLSLLKIILFFCGSSFAILVFHLTNKPEKFLSWMIAIFLNLILFSSFSLVFGGSTGFHLGMSSLFQGVFIHPNKMGIHLIPFLIIFAYYLSLKDKKKYTLILFLSILLIFYFIYLSGSRGAISTLAICLIITFFISLFNKKYITQIKKIFKNSFILLFLLAIISIPFLDLIFNGFENFFYKGVFDENYSSVEGVFFLSRGWRIMMSYENFLNSPIIGNGFGTPTEAFVEMNEYYKITYDPIFNFPISAPTEKSFFFIGVLEEIGTVGLLLFIIYYYKYSKIIIQNSETVFIVALYIYIFISSMFEFYYFSMGTAAFQWLWIGYCSKLVLKNKLRIM